MAEIAQNHNFKKKLSSIFKLKNTTLVLYPYLLPLYPDPCMSYSFCHLKSAVILIASYPLYCNIELVSSFEERREGKACLTTQGHGQHLR